MKNWQNDFWNRKQHSEIIRKEKRRDREREKEEEWKKTNKNEWKRRFKIIKNFRHTGFSGLLINFTNLSFLLNFLHHKIGYIFVFIGVFFFLFSLFRSSKMMTVERRTRQLRINFLKWEKEYIPKRDESLKTFSFLSYTSFPK